VVRLDVSGSRVVNLDVFRIWRGCVVRLDENKSDKDSNRQEEVLYMKTTILPKTPVGKRSVYLFIIFIALSITGSIISNVQGNTIEYPNPINSPLLGTTIYLTFIIAAIAFITGLMAFFKSKERAILVYIIIFIGGYFSIAGLMLFTVGIFQNIRFGQ